MTIHVSCRSCKQLIRVTAELCPACEQPQSPPPDSPRFLTVPQPEALEEFVGEDWAS